MSRVQQFPKCGICGTYGHVDGKCPVRDLNATQELEAHMKAENVTLGLTPALEREIAALRRSWKEHKALKAIKPCLPSVLVTDAAKSLAAKWRLGISA